MQLYNLINRTNGFELETNLKSHTEKEMLSTIIDALCFSCGRGIESLTHLRDLKLNTKYFLTLRIDEIQKTVTLEVSTFKTVLVLTETV